MNDVETDKSNRLFDLKFENPFQKKQVNGLYGGVGAGWGLLEFDVIYHINI